jgi:deoxyhypusine synthase
MIPKQGNKRKNIGASSQGPISAFLEKHFRHFNAATVIEAAKAYHDQIAEGNEMVVTLAGAMSSAELGISLAEMIRRNKVHLISCTGANLEEDIFNLVAHKFYERIPKYRELSAKEEENLLKRHLNRVTDTCIPEMEAMRRMEKAMLKVWMEADQRCEQKFPHEFFYEVLRSKVYEKYYQIDPNNSWMLAASEKNLPIIVPGWEDSTLGNMYAAACLRGDIKNIHTVRTGIEYMRWLAVHYRRVTRRRGMGIFQIGGGIPGDFLICVVPMLQQDMGFDTRLWSYFCQISDSTTSYGSYSGAVPNEKITWGKLGKDTPKFIIESDATIVAPLIFAMVLNY